METTRKRKATTSDDHVENDKNDDDDIAVIDWDDEYDDESTTDGEDNDGMLFSRTATKPRSTAKHHSTLNSSSLLIDQDAIVHCFELAIQAHDEVIDGNRNEVDSFRVTSAGCLGEPKRESDHGEEEGKAAIEEKEARDKEEVLTVNVSELDAAATDTAVTTRSVQHGRWTPPPLWIVPSPIRLLHQCNGSDDTNTNNHSMTVATLSSWQPAELKLPHWAVLRPVVATMTTTATAVATKTTTASSSSVPK